MYRYFGIVVVETVPGDEFNSTTDNFDLAYPDLKPYNRSDSNVYYIAAAWNNVTDIPTQFSIGDGSTTMAVHNGLTEQYYNPKLKSTTEYCYFVFSQYTSIAANVCISIIMHSVHHLKYYI